MNVFAILGVGKDQGWHGAWEERPSLYLSFAPNDIVRVDGRKDEIAIVELDLVRRPAVGRPPRFAKVLPHDRASRPIVLAHAALHAVARREAKRPHRLRKTHLVGRPDCLVHVHLLIRREALVERPPDRLLVEADADEDDLLPPIAERGPLLEVGLLREIRADGAASSAVCPSADRQARMISSGSVAHQLPPGVRRKWRPAWLHVALRRCWVSSQHVPLLRSTVANVESLGGYFAAVAGDMPGAATVAAAALSPPGMGRSSKVRTYRGSGHR